MTIPFVIDNQQITAAEVLAKLPADPVPAQAIRLWGQLGELDIAVRLAEQAARAGKADAVLLSAGDACRFAGQYGRAITFYLRVASVSAGSEELAKNKELAAASSAALKGLNTFVLSRIPNGTYNADCGGYNGPITIEIVKQADDAKWFNRAKAVLNQIVQKQGTEGVNTVTRATFSSRGLINASADALDKARNPDAKE